MIFKCINYINSSSATRDNVTIGKHFNTQIQVFTFFNDQHFLGYINVRK